MYHRAEICPPFVAADVERGHCQGACALKGECAGPVRLVRVCGWGWFSYCAVAIEADLSDEFVLFDEHDEEILI